MSALIAKPASVAFSEKEVWREVIFKEPLYIGLAYADKGKVHVEKYIETFEKNKESNIDIAFKRLEALTDFNVIAFFESKRTKVFELDLNNMPPIEMNDQSTYVAGGTVLDLCKKSKKKYSDSFYLRDAVLNPVMKEIPDLFFDFSGIWLLEKFLPFSTAMIFLNGEGDFSIIHQLRGEMFSNMWCFNSDFKLSPIMTV